MWEELDLSLWWPWYRRIRRAFGFRLRDDRYAAKVLGEIVGGRFVGMEEVQHAIRGKNVVVFGAGPSLERDVRELSRFRDDCIFIAADGASRALVREGIEPDFVVTDLDGIVGSVPCSNSIYIVHAHGDNVKLLSKFVPEIRAVHPTTQAEPLQNVFNYGGFTDGDRACFIADEMKARMIVLAGMDFGKEIGKYSGSKENTLTVKKMRYARRLLSFLSSISASELYNATSKGIEIHGFRRVGHEELEAIIRA